MRYNKTNVKRIMKERANFNTRMLVKHKKEDNLEMMKFYQYKLREDFQIMAELGVIEYETAFNVEDATFKYMYK